MCRNGEPNLKRFISHRKRVLQMILGKDQRNGVKNSNLLENLFKDRELDVLEDVENDTLGFKIHLKAK